jgi:hypothetical protein
MLPLTPDELHEVTSQVGFALWQIQVLELAVGSYLVFVHKITPAIAMSEAHGMFARAGKSTLGQLLREIHATGKAPQHLTDALDAFVPKRNWLVHHSRHESHRHMYSAAGRASLMAKIDATADDALNLMKAFDAATEAHLETLGIPKEQIDRDTAKLLREWTEGV